MKHKIWQKVFALLSIVVLVFNSVGPMFAVAYANDETTPAPEATQEVTPAPEVSQEASPTPTIDQSQSTETPTPTPAPTDQITPTETATPVPEQITETPTPTETLIIDATPIPANDSSPPSDNSSNNPSTDDTNSSDNNSSNNSTPTESPTILSTPTTTVASDTKDDQINAIILKNISAPSIDLDAVEESGSATLTTDKTDYAPTDTALIMGSNLNPNTTYSLTISSSDNPATSTTVDVTTDDKGVFAYAYQLDGNYRSNYKVELKDASGTIVATTAFTDSAPFSAQTVTSACMGDQPNSTIGSCTANDISIASVSSITINGHGCRFPGDTVNFTANWEIESSANERYNVGLWFATGGQTDPLYGTCSVSTLPSSPSPFFEEVPNSVTELCGDITNAGTGTESITMTAICNPDSSGFLKLPYCTSWLQNKNEDGACHTPTDTMPGTGSKCSCEPGFTVPISVPPSSIEVVKNLVPANDSGLFNLQVNGITATGSANVGNGGDTGKVGVAAGSNNFGETAGTLTNLSNYTSSASCVDATTGGAVSTTGTNPWTVNTAVGQNIVCTITNTKLSASITVNKTLVPSNDPGLFNLQIDGSTAGTGGNVGNGGTTGAITVLTTGTHTVSETAGNGTNLSDYTTTYSCNNNLSGSGTSVGPFSVTANQNVICTFTNTRNTGSVNAHKLVDADGNGTYEINTDSGANALGFNWSLDTVGTNSFGTAVNNVNTGSHNVNENSVSGYHFVGWYLTSDTSKTCTNTTNTTLPASISVTNGSTTNITLCNARNTGSITINKNVDNNNDGDTTDPGDVVGATDWTWDIASGEQNIATGQSRNLVTGNYTITEDVKANYHIVGWTCTDQSSGTTNSIPVNLAANGQSITCTITNARDTGTIKVIKDVEPNDNSQWDIDISGPTPNTDTLSDGENTGVLSSATGSYTVTETAHTGTNQSDYNSSYVCTDLQGAVTSGNGTSAIFNLTSNQNVVCTFTNSIKRGTIIVEKQTNPDQDSADFVFTGDAAGTISDGEQITVNNVLPGTYTSTESPLAGWDLTGISCNDTTNGGTASTGSLITRTATFNVHAGETVKCTFTNTKRAHIIIQKNAINDSSQAFTFNNNFGNGNPSSFNLTDDSTPGLPSYDAEVLPGKYVVSENTVLGWQSPESTSCDQGETVDDIDVSAGETVTCTFVNEELAKIILVKNAVGGNDTFDFDATGAGLPADIDLTTVAGTASQTFENLDPDNTYTIAENAPAGWVKTSATCDNGDPLTAITPSAGEVITCTFSNTKYATIIVKKTMVGGTDGFNFTGDVSGAINANGATLSVGNLLPGTYTSTEIDKTGWDLTGISCDDNDSTADLQTKTATFNVSAGEVITCTFSNTKRGTITVEKITDPNGSEQTFGFVLGGDATGSANISDGGSHLFDNLLAGNYTLVENPTTGWDLKNASCTTNQDRSLPYDGNQITSITLHSGEDILCLFTNEQRGKVIVTKYNDINGDGKLDQGEGVLSGWTINLGEDSDDTDSNGQAIFDNLQEGSYPLSEDLKSGWEQTNIICDQRSFVEGDVNVNAGQTVNCSILNHSLTPTLTISKENDAVGTKNAGDSVGYTIVVNVNDADANNLTVTDLLPKGFVYNSGSWSVDLNGSPLSVPEPTYASPGVWTLGNAHDGDVFTLKYTAKIDGGIQPGTYKDVAWAEGFAVGNATNEILATALPLGFVDTYFVGTQVTIAEGGQGGPDYKVTTLQEVLGAATSELPATGESTVWVIIATIIGLLGVGSLITGFKLRKRYA